MNIATLPHARTAARDQAAGRLRSLPRDCTEKAFQAAVRAYAVECGWLVFTTFDSRRSPSGEPDLRLIRKGDGVLWCELKSRTGRLSQAQKGAIWELARCGQTVVVWRPADVETVIGLLT